MGKKSWERQKELYGEDGAKMRMKLLAIKQAKEKGSDYFKELNKKSQKAKKLKQHDRSSKN